MEYTNDLILNVNMKDVKHKIKEGKSSWTSTILNSIKKHKTITIATISLSLFIAIDIALLTNFMYLLTSI